MNTWYNQWQQSAQQPWNRAVLGEPQDQAFQNWMQQLPWFTNIQQQAGIPAPQLLQEMTGPDSDYDYRRAYTAGITPSLYQYDGTYHWPSSTDAGQMLKSPTHPTAWMEYFMQGSNGIDPNQFGLQTPENARTWLNQYNSVLNSSTW